MGNDELMLLARKLIKMMEGHATRDSLMALLPKEADMMSKLEVVGQLAYCLAA